MDTETETAVVHAVADDPLVRTRRVRHHAGLRDRPLAVAEPVMSPRLLTLGVYVLIRRYRADGNRERDESVYSGQ